MNNLVQFDINAASALHSALTGRADWLDGWWKLTGVYLTYAVPVLLLWWWFSQPKLRQLSLHSFLVGVFGWVVVAKLLGRLWLRTRPIDALVAQKEILFTRPTSSFPSDHALFLFALATGFYFSGQRKIGGWLLVVAFLVSFARVVIAVHYPLDVVVGALLGLLVGWLGYLARDTIDKYLTNPLIALLKWLRLA